MKHAYTWLLVAALLALLAPSALLAEDGTGFSSSVEVGAAGMSVDDEVNKVNEYSSIRDDDGVNPYFRADLKGSNGGTHVDLEAERWDDDVFDIDLDVDASRIFRFDASYGEFRHWLSHDQLDYMRATMKTDAQTSDGPPESANPAIYSEDLVPDQDFFIIHKELEAEGEVVIPDLPNVTLKTGYRQEEREGTEQVFGMSHCSACHIEGSSKKIDETTTDITLGATGKFGMLTVDYEYLTRDFDDNSADKTREYLLAAKPVDGLPTADFTSARLLFDQNNGYVPYSTTPDSEKDSHTVKARYDLSKNSTISAGYIHTNIESSKQDDVGRTLEDNQLSTDYDSYNMRASTRLGSWRLTGYGRYEEIDSDSNSIYFTYGNGTDVPAIDERTEYESEEDRDVTTVGGNAVYRFNSKTSLRLGYEYEDIDRDYHDAIDTETHTVKASVRFRPTNKLNSRASYTYQKIDDQFEHPHGNKGPESQDIWAGGSFPDGKRWYEPSFYALREAEATNLPEDVHEVKASTTWTPSASYSVTVYARYRHEENDLNFNTYEKDVISPGLNVWWAPVNDLNMTMAYNFDKQKTENQMCVGWYHG